ncbi:MAG: hypothetical protein IJU52_07815 [Clostridia bacterium]|nr:hypothetical protein [Clostridia bacterium]
MIYRKKYATMEEVKTDVFRYIELFYNRKQSAEYPADIRAASGI